MGIISSTSQISDLSGNDGSGNVTSTVSTAMSASEVIPLLVKHGCPDVTGRLNLKRCGRRPIAGGGFGDIYQGMLVGNQKVAIKCARLHLRNGDDGSKVLKRAAHELYTWSSLKHENIVELIGLAQFRGEISMVSPWMENGTLPDYISRHPEVDRVPLCYQISAGLVYLHNRGRVHGDIKGQNVLVSGEGVAKLTDFGNTTLKEYTLQFATTTSKPTISLRWAAPELLSGTTGHSETTDVYALGMTILEVITGKVPFHDKVDVAVCGVVFKYGVPGRPDFQPIDEDNASSLWGLMLRCWDRNPATRPSSTNVQDTLQIIQESLVSLTGSLADTPRISRQHDLILNRTSIISSAMSTSDVISLLVQHGCTDVTGRLDLKRCGGHPIAGGGFGDIYQGMLVGNQKVSIKCARLYLRNGGYKALKRAARELYAWSSLKHPNIVELVGLAQFRGQISIISPWMDNGPLPDYISRHPEVDRVPLCYQISAGLVYLHNRGTVHGSIRGGNVLVSGQGVAQLTNFGDAALKEYTLQFTTTTSRASFSLRWTAPELLDGTTGVYSEKADVYALGMTILEVITGKVPFHDKVDQAAYNFIFARRTPERPTDFLPIDERKANALWDLMVRCWDRNPATRPSSVSARDILQAIQGGSTFPRYESHSSLSVSRSGLRTGTTKRKQALFGFMDGFLAQNKREVSIPHPTHAGPSTGGPSGLPKEWKQSLADSSISRLEQERNSEAVRESMKVDRAPQTVPCLYRILDKTLGSGTYTVVKDAVHIKTGKYYACKVINKKLMEGREHMVHNLVVLKKVSSGHKNIITLHDYFETAHNLYLVFDLCTGGELLDRICARGNYSEVDAANLVRTLMLAVEHIHAVGIVHRNLEPKNLLFRTKADDTDIIIAGFGSSRMVNENRYTLLTGACGTLGYMAPEIIKKTGHHKPVDVWAMGVITYFLLCGYTPFDRDNQQQEMEAIIRGDYKFEPAKYWAHVSPIAKDFVRYCLTIDPTKRPTATEALQHKWLADITPHFAPGQPTNLLPYIQKPFDARKTFRKAVIAIIAVRRMSTMSVKPSQLQLDVEQYRKIAEEEYFDEVLAKPVYPSSIIENASKTMDE